MIIDDKLHLIVFYDPARLDRRALQSYGMIVDDFAPNLNIIYLRLNTVDDGYGSQCVLSVPGVLGVEHNKVMRGRNHSITLNDNFAFRNDLIYQEMELYDAWAITKGDPRIKIGVIDSGVDMAHPDINCGVGGIFQYGIYSVNGHYPIAVDWSALSYNLGISDGLEFYKYHPNWMEIMKTQGVGGLGLADIYTDSTCKTLNPNWGSGLLWFKEPFLLCGVPESSASYIEGAFGHLCMRDGFGHGTAIAGLISSPHNGNGFAGIAPDCTTLMYKWTDDFYAGSVMAACAAIKKAVDDGCHVITMSWGGPTANTSLLTATIQYAYGAGSLLIGSSGNAGQYPNGSAYDLLDWPAAYEEVVGVGGCGWNSPTATGGQLDNGPELMDFSRVSPFAQRFPEVDLVAPAWGWIFHAPTEHAQMWYGYRFNAESKHYSFMSDGGTSFSNPATGAIGALCMSKKLQLAGVTAETIPLSQQPWTPATAKGWLTGGCRLPLAWNGTGAGRLSAKLALGAVT